MFDVALYTYALYFGSASNGSQTVEFIGGSVTLPGSNYNNYQLKYDALTDTISLWINGAEYADNIYTNQHEPYPAVLSWESGYYGSQNALANWSQVSLEITPEPSTVAVILLGSSVLLCFRHRHRP